MAAPVSVIPFEKPYPYYFHGLLQAAEEFNKHQREFGGCLPCANDTALRHGEDRISLSVQSR